MTPPHSTDKEAYEEWFAKHNRNYILGYGSNYQDSDLYLKQLISWQAARQSLLSENAKLRADVERAREALATCQTLHNSQDYYQVFDDQLVHEALHQLSGSE